METKHFTILRVCFFFFFPPLDKVFALICMVHEPFLHLEHSKILEDFLNLKTPKICQNIKTYISQTCQIILQNCNSQHKCLIQMSIVDYLWSTI